MRNANTDLAVVICDSVIAGLEEIGQPYNLAFINHWAEALANKLLSGEAVDPNYP